MAMLRPLSIADYKQLVVLLSMFGLEEGMILTNGTDFYFKSGGSTVAKLDSNGNLYLKGQITTGATTAELT